MERTTRLWDQSSWDSHYHEVGKPHIDNSVLQIE